MSRGKGSLVYDVCQWAHGTCGKKPVNGKYCSPEHARFAGLGGLESSGDKRRLKTMVDAERNAEEMRKGKKTMVETAPIKTEAPFEVPPKKRAETMRFTLSTLEMGEYCGYSKATLSVASLKGILSEKCWLKKPHAQRGRRMWDPQATLLELDAAIIAGRMEYPRGDGRKRFLEALDSYSKISPAEIASKGVSAQAGADRVIGLLRLSLRDLISAIDLVEVKGKLGAIHHLGRALASVEFNVVEIGKYFDREKDNP